MRRFVLAVGLFALTVFPPTALAQALGSLSGEVTDVTGARIAEATIIVRHDSLGFERRAQARDGAFRVADLPPGDYQVTASFDGFTTSTRRVSLSGGDSATVHFRLLVGRLTEDVVVNATEVAGGHEALRRLPGSVEILDREALERGRVFTTNEALRKVSGLHVRDEEGFGLRPNIGIRGINPTRSNKVLLLEDGIPLAYAPYGDNASYYHPPIERFQRIEVMKGGAQIAYGPQTVGGLINYVTPPPPSRTSGSVMVTGGNRDYVNGQGTFGGTFGGTGLLLDYMRKQGDGARENLHSELNDLTAKVVRTTARGQTWTFRGNYYSEDSNVTYSGLRQDEFDADPRANPFQNDFFYIDRVGTSGTQTAILGGRTALTTNVYFSSFRRHWWRQSSNSAQRPNDVSDPTCGGMANLNTTCGNEGRLRQYYTWGIEPRLRVSHRAFGLASETDFGVRAHFENQDRRQENGPTPTSRSGTLVEDNLRTTAAYSGFVQNRFLFGTWTVTPGVRLEHVDNERTNRLTSASGEASLTRVVPGIGVSHAATQQVTWFGGVHRGFAPPRTEDIISNAGGVVELDPELSWNYEAGVRTMPRSGVRADATVFVVDYENQIVPASLAGGVGATLTNAGATLHRGLEMTARLDTAAITGGAHNVFVRSAYTFLPIARFTGTRFSAVGGSGGVSVSGNRLPYAPEHLLTVGGGYRHSSGLDGMLEAVHTSEQFGDDLNTVTPTPDGQRGLIPAYTVWNAAFGYDLPRGATVFLTIKNLFDDVFIVDRVRGILPGTPRLVQAGVRVGF